MTTETVVAERGPLRVDAAGTGTWEQVRPLLPGGLWLVVVDDTADLSQCRASGPPSSWLFSDPDGWAAEYAHVPAPGHTQAEKYRRAVIAGFMQSPVERNRVLFVNESIVPTVVATQRQTLGWFDLVVLDGVLDKRSIDQVKYRVRVDVDGDVVTRYSSPTGLFERAARAATR